MSGKVFIASMNLRGAWAPAPADTTKVNVTSAQGLANKNRRDFSPMTQIEGGYEGFWNFEAFWQSGKVFEGISEQKVKTFWHNVTEAKRRYPGSKGKKVLHAHFECEPDQLMDYVTSRKQIYVPRYTALIQDREITLFWKQQVDAGTNKKANTEKGKKNQKNQKNNWFFLIIQK